MRTSSSALKIEHGFDLIAVLPNNALVLTLLSSGRNRGVGGLSGGACAFAPLRRGALCAIDADGGLPATQHSASRWTAEQTNGGLSGFVRRREEGELRRDANAGD